MVKGPELVKTYATEGRRSLRKWHIFLRRVTFGCALLLMVASIWALHWACELIGLPPVISWVVPLAMEAGMASVASVATTIRKDKTNKQREKGRPGSYYVSLWLIFSFIMALAQAANIAHALVGEPIGTLVSTREDA